MGISLTPEYYYKTMPLQDIKNLPVQEISDKKSVLFLWATTPLIKEALDVMQTWDFKYVTMITWHKTNNKGPGYWFRGYTEHLLFGIKGSIKSFRSRIRNIQEARVLKHSQKPELFRKLIEQIAPTLNPRIELFARQKVDGWDVWGNEVSTRGIV